MTTATKVLQVAAGEVGYSRWNDPQQGTKYGRWYAALGKGSYYGTNGVPYCAMFASWVFSQAGAKCVGLPEAYCPYIVSAAQKAGAWVGRSQLKPGDLILFSWSGGVADHVGLVEKVFSGYVQTIEGNTSSASNANGGLVARRTRSLDYTVLGGVRPAYGGGSTPSTGAASGTTGKLTSTDKQLALAVDGVLGGSTIARWQQVMGTPIDGVLSDESQCIMAFQRFLNKELGAGHIKNLTGKTSLDVDGYIGACTTKAWQFWSANRFPGHLKNIKGWTLTSANFGQWVDGIWGKDTTRMLQAALNDSYANSGKIGAKK